jgi:hypothetical protein
MYEKIMSIYQMTKTFGFTIVSNKPLFGSLFSSSVAVYFTPELIIIVAVMLPLQLHCRDTETAVLLDPGAGPLQFKGIQLNTQIF